MLTDDEFEAREVSYEEQVNLLRDRGKSAELDAIFMQGRPRKITRELVALLLEQTLDDTDHVTPQRLGGQRVSYEVLDETSSSYYSFDYENEDEREARNCLVLRLPSHAA